MKICITCNIEKKLTDFADKRNQCKSCRKEARKCIHGKFKCKECIEEKQKLIIENKEKEENKEKINEEIKLCTNCNIEKKISDFYKNHGRCKECYNISRKCEHNIYIEICEECKDIGKCEIHSLKKCIECNTIKICINCNIEKNINEFRKNRNDCKKCEKIKNKCEHNIRKEYCLDCIDGGSALCIHKIRKSRCKECDGNYICTHMKEKDTCYECTPNSNKFCITHKKIKIQCYDCTPNSKYFCIKEGCKVAASNKLYKGYCAQCFYDEFPNEVITRNYKIKERAVFDFIKNEYNNLDNISFDRKIKGGNSLKRPDILFIFDNKYIIVEVDENQHKNYNKEYEKERLNIIKNDINVKTLILIKFNPDSYKIGIKNIKSCWVIKKDDGKLELNNTKQWNKRLNTLKETINHYINNDITELFTMINLFYDE